MSQDRHDRAAAAADAGVPRGRRSAYRGERGGWGPRSSRGRRQQCELLTMFLPCDVSGFAPFSVCLTSANRHQLIVPHCPLNTYGRRVFSIAGPMVWNSLPDELRDPACGSDSFKQFLKTILLSLY